VHTLWAQHPKKPTIKAQRTTGPLHQTKTHTPAAYSKERGFGERAKRERKKRSEGMASEVAMAANTEVAVAAAEEETVTTKVPHKLERRWAFWFDNQSKPKQGAAWGSSLRKLYTFDTVEEFWWYAFQFYHPPPSPSPSLRILILCLILIVGDFIHVLVLMSIWVRVISSLLIRVFLFGFWESFEEKDSIVWIILWFGLIRFTWNWK